ncbi:MAG: B12-binding domain-containing radical SAM protein [Deltaproteobacteria bacterium]|nr:B12-binding domain-containing radical SAM protein [Deltaproteobacteria bacterium]
MPEPRRGSDRPRCPPPIGLAYAASFLRAEGVPCRLRDFAAEGVSPSAALDELGGPTDLLCVRVTAPTLDRDLAWLREAKKRRPDLFIVAITSMFGDETGAWLDRHEVVDGVLRSDSESTLSLLARGVEDGLLTGFIARGANGHAARYDARQSDFPNYILPARDLLRHELYRSPVTGAPMTIVETSRGCPFLCVFCPANALTAGRVHQRPVANVLDELEVCVREHGLRDVLFQADTFTLDRAWVRALCDGIIDRKIPLRWAANSRADTVDLETLKRMKAAGCTSLGFGVESGDDEQLRLMKKNLTTAQIRHAFALCREAGLRAHAFFVIGLPWETRASLDKTERFARELAPDFLDINIAFPLPNTEYDRIARRESLLERPIAGRGYATSPVRSRSVAHGELQRRRRRMLLSAYIRPLYAWRTLRREASTFPQALRLIGYGLRRVGQLALSR